MSILTQDGRQATPGYGASIAICIPSQDQVAAGFMADLAHLVGFTAKHRPDLTIRILHMRGTLIADQRHNLVVEALSKPCDYLFWLDADMAFPADTLLVLLAHLQPIVCANYATRRFPTIPTAEIRAEGLVYSGPDATGLVEVDRAGMGVMLVQADVYRRTPMPWFLIGFNPKTGGYTGEDVYFCRKAKDAGFPTQIDLGLSGKVGHIGEFVYRMEHAWVQQQAMHDAADVAEQELTAVGAP